MLSLSLTNSSSLFAQQENEQITLKEAFELVEKSKNVKFFYQLQWIENRSVPREILKLALPDFLNAALQNTGYNYTIYKQKYIILLSNGGLSSNTQRENIIDEESFVAKSGEFSISGKIKDANSGESIIGAALYFEEVETGAVSNSFGYYSISLPSGIYTVRVSAMGKASSSQRIFLDKNISLDIELYDHLTQLNEVVVKADAIDKNISSPEMGLVKLDTKTMQSIPAFLGETDVIRSITMLPGVSTVGEGAAGFNVRGGNTDQNLILIDDVPVFNSSHLFGFFSMINTDIVKDVTLYKGGMPAQYGGRVASVLDLKLKDGNSKEFTGNGGLGIISSRLSLEGPIVKDKLSFLVAGRYAYPNWILKKVPDYNIRNSEGYFYDANITLNYQINENNSLRLSSYYSVDGFKFAADTLYGWSTLNTTLKWNTLLSKKLFVSTSFINSNYSYDVEGETENTGFTARFGIETIGAKVDLSYFANLKHKFDFGVSSLVYDLNPGKLSATPESALNARTLQNERAIESAAYISDEFKITPRLTILAGLRYSRYSSLGPQEVFIYSPGVPRTPSSIIDTLSYSRNKVIKTYSGLEPRLSARLTIDNQSSVKASYNKTIQYLHLISNTTAISPIDIWKSSNANIPPQQGHQFSLGYFRNLKNNTIETSAEIYYKQVYDLVEYKDGADLFLNPLIETELIPAFGKAYGVELLIRKNYGTLTGWVGYTYSRSLRKSEGLFPTEIINRGRFFPANYDKPHDLTVVTNYKFNRRISLSTNFTYSTGRPITYPDAVFIVDGYTVVQFTERNQARIPDYHRLDISLTIDKPLKQTQRFRGSWNFAIYNLYGRKNPYSVFFKPTYKGSIPQAYRLAVLGSIFPSISYNFKF